MAREWHERQKQRAFERVGTHSFLIQHVNQKNRKVERLDIYIKKKPESEGSTH